MQRRDLPTLLASTLLLAPALAQAQPADPTGQARLVAERFAATLAVHDIVAFSELFADTYRNHQASAAAPKPPPGISDKVATIAFFQARLTALPDLAVGIEHIVAAPNQVAASYFYTGTQQATYLGVPATGKRLTFTSCDIFRLENGLIAEHWGMGDIAGILAQLKA